MGTMRDHTKQFGRLKENAHKPVYPLDRFTDLELMQEIVRRIKLNKLWNHYGMEIEGAIGGDYVDIEFSKRVISGGFGFMFSTPSGKLERIWGDNPHDEFMKL